MKRPTLAAFLVGLAACGEQGPTSPADPPARRRARQEQGGQYGVAINILKAFVSHIIGLRDTGVLDAQSAQALIDQAQILIAQCTALL